MQADVADLEYICTLLHIPGLAAIVVQDGQAVWQRVFGWADVEQRIPVSPSTPFSIASLTKTMTAIVLMQSVREGLVGLDDPMTQYIDAHTLPQMVTIRQVVSHTSEGNPGEEYLYNGKRYALLSRVMEAASRQPFHELLATRVFLPLAMTDTIPGLGTPNAALRQPLARPYTLNQETHRIEPGPLPAPGVTAATGVVSTILDLARYAQALDQGRMISETEAELM